MTSFTGHEPLSVTAEHVGTESRDPAERIAELEEKLARLHDGRDLVVPTSRKHALDMLAVAEAGVKHWQT